MQLACRRQPDLTAGAAFAYYPRALAVAASHRLAAHNTVSVEDLADEEVALLPPSIPPAVYDLIVPPRTPSGRPIRRTQPVQTINEILSLVARGRIVHPTSSAVPIFNRDDIVLIPIDDLPPCHWVWSGAPAGRIHASAPLTKSPPSWPSNRCAP